MNDAMPSSSRSSKGGRPADPVDNQPWWRYRMVWLVVGGPALVVVASISTLVIAVRHPDPVVVSTTAPAEDADPARKDPARAAALQPAMAARNHAATGGQAR
ncbi:MAG: hypothetical protein RL722_562 [Pseudomonadota bacterium]|jgi:hypothetical protein